MKAKAKQNSAAAMAKIQKALKSIEAAQGLIGNACADLSSVKGAIKQWEKTGALYDTIKNHWYELRNFSMFDRGLELDSEPEVPRDAGEEA